jgi:hypothetical protein
MGDFFDVRRGIATGANGFFILSPGAAESLRIPREFLTPILPSPRYLDSDVVGSNEDGTPLVERAGFLFSSDMPAELLRVRHPDVWRYLQDGEARGVSERYLCRNRDPWYLQEKRTVTPFLCTYMGRGSGDGASPFRFILNRSRAIAANVYLMLYPRPWLRKELQERPGLDAEVWRALTSIPPASLRGEGRVYGGGLHKIEPKELLNTPVPELSALFPERAPSRPVQMQLL